MRPILSPGKVFVVSALVLVLAGVAGLTVLSSATRIGSDHITLDVTGERVVYANTVRMQGGDLLLVRPAMMGAPASVVGNYSFYVVPAGERYAFVDGRPPSTVHAQVDGLRAGHCCSPDVVWRRPDAPGPSPARTSGFPRDATERMLVEEAMKDPRYVDVVWVFEYRAGYPAPADEEERRALDRVLEEHFRQVAFAGRLREMPTVVAASAAAAVPFFFGLMALAAVGVAVSAIAWVRRVGRATIPPEASGTEAWLRLYDAAGTYLASVRDLLVASVVVAVLVGLHVALEGEPAPLLEIADRLQIGSALGVALGAAVAFLYLVVLAGWAVTLWRVQRALVAWRRRSAEPPLET